MKKSVYEFIPIAFGVVLTLGVVSIFHACEAMEDGSWMNCHYAQMDVFYLGIALTALSLISIFIKNNTAKLTVDILSIAAAVVIMLIPGTIVSLCMMTTMRCNALMRPFAIVLSAFYIVSKAADIILRTKTHRKSEAITA